MQEGRAGLQETRYRVNASKRRGGAARVHRNGVVEAPVDRIVAYGARIAQQIIDTPSGPRHYWRRLCVYATSYNPRSNGGTTATSTGATLAKGIVAAKPHIILITPRCMCRIMASASCATPALDPQHAYWIDLGYSDHDWVTWGSYTWVYLLAPPPDEINYDLPPWAPVRNRPRAAAASSLPPGIRPAPAAEI